MLQGHVDDDRQCRCLSVPFSILIAGESYSVAVDVFGAGWRSMLPSTSPDALPGGEDCVALDGGALERRDFFFFTLDAFAKVTSSKAQISTLNIEGEMNAGSCEMGLRPGQIFSNSGSPGLPARAMLIAASDP